MNFTREKDDQSLTLSRKTWVFLLLLCSSIWFLALLILLTPDAL